MGYILLFINFICFSIAAPTQVRIYSKEEHELEVGQFFSDGKSVHQFVILVDNEDFREQLTMLYYS